MGSRFIALMAAVLGVIALAVAGVYFYRPHAASPSVVTGESPSPASGQPKPQSEAKPAESAPLKPTAVPSFDVVRIEPSGEGVIAGRAEPGWSVRVESGSTIVAETRADDQEGAWSIVLDKPLPSGDYSLSLRAISPDGTRALTAQQSVPGAVGKASGAAVAQNEPSKTLEPQKEEAARVPSGEQRSATEAPAKSEQQSGATALDSQPQPVVPNENAKPAERPKPPVRIKNVEYQDTGPDTGKMSISGVGDPNVSVFFFFDEDPLGRVTIGSDGTWAFEIEKKLGAGEHTIRADTFDEKTGMVAGRASVNIGREPEVAQPETAKEESAVPQPEGSPPGSSQALSQTEPEYRNGPPEPEASSPAESLSVATAEPPSLSSQPQPVYPDEASQPEAAKSEAPAARQPEAAPPRPSTPAVTAEQPSAAEPAESKQPPVVFKSVDYEDTGPQSGKISLAGTGDPGSRILLFLDEDPLGQLIIGSGATWTFETQKKLENGQHAFRADRINERTGIVVGRASIGIVRMRMEKPPEERAEAPAPSAPAPSAGSGTVPPAAQPGTQPAPRMAAAEEAKPAATGGRPAHRKRHWPKVYTVRRGDTLWEIAESYYGGGWHYRAIVRDNRHKIHNPHLIFPKQKFRMPVR